MAGNVKDIIIRNIQSATIVYSGTADFIGFTVGWVYMLDESIDQRFGYSWAKTGIQKVIISPKGVAYPGDTAPGNGPKKVTVDFLGTPATVIMTQVENVDTETGWVIITKGDHIIAYSPSIINTLTVEPT